MSTGKCQTCGQPAVYHHIRTNRDYCKTHIETRDQREGRYLGAAFIVAVGVASIVVAMVVR